MTIILVRIISFELNYHIKDTVFINNDNVFTNYISIIVKNDKKKRCLILSTKLCFRNI